MRIVCGNCNTEYDIDLPPSALQRPNRNLKFRCSSCGRTFVTRLDAGGGAPSAGRAGDESSDRGRGARASATTTTPAPQPAGAPKSMLLKQEGKVYSVRDVATLQRWIVERRVARDDMVSFGGTVFEPAGSRPEFESFFEIVEQADSSPPPGDAAEASSSDAPMPSGSWAPWERSNSGPPAQSAPPPRQEESENSEILPSLEAEEDLDAMEAGAGALSLSGGGREAVNHSRTELPSNLLGGSAPRSAGGGDDGPGVPTGFPMPGAAPAAPTSGPRSGVTSRDQVFDAFPMDMAPEAPAMPVLAPTPPAPMMTGLPTMPSGPAVSSMPVGPVGPALHAPSGVTLPPVPSRPVEPSVATLPSSLPLDAPTPAPGLPNQDLRRPPRGLDWDEGRRAAPPSNQSLWLAVGAVILAVLGVGLFLWQQILAQRAAQLNAAQVVATAPAPTAPAAVVPSVAGVAPAAASTPATTPPATPPAPETAPAPPPAADPPKTTAPKSSGGGGSRSKVQKGWTLMEKGDYSGARTTCMDAVGSGPVGAEAWFCAGRAAEYQGDVPNAVNFYCRALNAGPDAETVSQANGRLSSLGRSCP